MCWRGFSLVAFGLLGLASCHEEHRHLDATIDRARHLREKCRMYSDPLRPEHGALFGLGEHNLRKRMAIGVESKLMMCVPGKVGSQAWRRMAIKIRAEETERLGTEVAQRLKKEKFQFDTKFYQTTKRGISVRHPFERLLSSYLFIFLDSTVHSEITKKVKRTWFEQRDNSKDRLDTPASFKVEMYDNSNEETLTFRQFVNFLTKCPSEMEECKVWTSEGVAEHWIPFWRHCLPCTPASEYDFVFELGPDVEAEKQEVLDHLGIDSKEPLVVVNPTVKASAADKEVKQKYYGQLSKEEIMELYQLYRLDFDLFGYEPHEYIAYGMDGQP